MCLYSYIPLGKVLTSETTQLCIVPFYSFRQPDGGCTVWPKHVAVVCSTVFGLEVLCCTEDTAGSNCSVVVDIFLSANRRGEFHLK